MQANKSKNCYAMNIQLKSIRQLLSGTIKVGRDVLKKYLCIKGWKTNKHNDERVLWVSHVFTLSIES